MSNLSNEKDFLQFCDSIDLSSIKGAYFEVDNEVTGVIDE